MESPVERAWNNTIADQSGINYYIREVEKNGPELIPVYLPNKSTDGKLKK